MNNANATRIGNRVGLAAKDKPKPKPFVREICPRFQPSLTHISSIRSRNATPRLDTDKSKLATPTKKPTTVASVHSNGRISQSAKSATPTKKSVESARNRPQTAKSNAKPKPTAV